MKDRIFVRLVSIFLAITIVIGIIPIRVVRADSVNKINENLSITYQELSSWGNYTQAQVDIKNVSDSKIDGWQVKLTYEKYVSVSSIWNAVLCESDISSENALYIINEDYNSVIEADQVVSFGLIIESGSEHLPTVEIVDCLEDLPTDDETELFSSAVFAGNDFNFSGWKANVYGSFYTGNNFNYQGSELYLYGSLDVVNQFNYGGWSTEIGETNVNCDSQEMPDFDEGIFSLREELDVIEDDTLISSDSIIANGFYYTEGDVTISGYYFRGRLCNCCQGQYYL